MPFQKGHKKSGGRQKGTPNRNSLLLHEKARELGVNPFEVLLYFVAGDWQRLGYQAEQIVRHASNGVINTEYTIEPSVRARAASEACQYLYPKLKSIDHTVLEANEVMERVESIQALTSQQKLHLIQQLQMALHEEANVEESESQ